MLNLNNSWIDYDFLLILLILFNFLILSWLLIQRMNCCPTSCWLKVISCLLFWYFSSFIWKIRNSRKVSLIIIYSFSAIWTSINDYFLLFTYVYFICQMNRWIDKSKNSNLYSLKLLTIYWYLDFGSTSKNKSKESEICINLLLLNMPRAIKLR